MARVSHLYSLDATTFSYATIDICSCTRAGGVSSNWEGLKSGKNGSSARVRTDPNVGTKRPGAERSDTL